jgi:sigma-E factor negative regulatory protein RseC
MIEERAVILSLEVVPTHSYSIATLEIERQSACGLCGKTRGCGNAIWGKLFAHQSAAFKAKNHINATVGQSVIVGINEQALLKSALLLYMVPLVFMFIATILVMQVTPSELAAIFAAFVGLLIGFVWVKGHTASSQYFLLQQPSILRLASHEAEIKFQ